MLVHIGRHDSREIMEAVNLLVPALTRSRFYREYPEDMDAVVPRVLRQVSAHYDSRCKRTMVEQYFGAYSEFSVTLFEAAVFLDRAGARSAVPCG